TTVFVQDVHLKTGTVTTNGAGFVPPISPGSSFTLSIPLIVTVFYNDTHQIRASIGGAKITTNYTLSQGQCNNPPNVSPTAVSVQALPSATFTSVPPTATHTSVARKANLQLNGIVLNPAIPVCGQTFNVVLNMTNTGNAASTPTTVTVQDVHLASGTVT